MKKKIIYIVILVILSVGVICVGWYMLKPKIDSKIEEPKAGDSSMGFFNMAQSDKDRITEIVTNVSDDAIPVTEEMRQEVDVLFAKYNMTDINIELFKLAGPGFVSVSYDVLFFADALESLKTGVPFKSETRAYVEGAALYFKTMTEDTITMYNNEIEKIAKKEPALNPPQILTEDDLIGLFNYSRARLLRLDALFE
mgnify:CR=1 FL=1